jgi:hypothetical protein
LPAKDIRRKTWKLVFFTLFLVYPGVSSTALRLFVCKTVNGVSYLLADFGTFCYTSDWDAYRGLAIFMILLYAIGIPFFFFLMLYRYRLRLNEMGVRLELGFIYDAYEYNWWFFELIDMVRSPLFLCLFVVSCFFFFFLFLFLPSSFSVYPRLTSCSSLLWSPSSRSMLNSLSLLVSLSCI